MDDIDFFTPGARLALELECLLLDTRDTAAKSRWWDSAWEALEQWRQAVREMERAMMADDAKRHPLDVTPDSAVDEDMWVRLEVLAKEMNDIRRRLDAEAPGSYDPIELLFSGQMGEEETEEE